MKKGSSKVWLLSGLVLMFVSSSIRVHAADALDHWTTIPVTNLNEHVGGGFGPMIRGVAHGNGRFVAVGLYDISDFGFIESSDDGLNWTVRGDGPSLPPSGSLYNFQMFDVAFGNGRFVAVGYDGYTRRNLYTSTNGIDWLSATNGNVDNFFSVAYGNGTFVAVGDGPVNHTSYYPYTNGNIYTSINGTNWIKRNDGSPPDDAHILYDVVYGTDRFVAVDTSGYAYMSLTGTTWTRTAVGGTSSISFANGKFIMPHTTGSTYVSTDGLTWTVATNNADSSLGHIVYDHGLYAALSGTTLFTSTDATNWISRGVSTAQMVDLIFGPRNLVAVGYATPTPYKAQAIISDPFVTLNTAGGASPKLSICGLQNHSYEIDYKTNLTDANWNPLATFTLTNSPCVWTDTTATNTQRFYRTSLLP